MSKKQVIGHHVALSPSLVLRDGDRLVGKRFIVGGSVYGRVLFTQQEPVVRVETSGAREVYIAHCDFNHIN